MYTKSELAADFVYISESNESWEKHSTQRWWDNLPLVNLKTSDRKKCREMGEFTSLNILKSRFVFTNFKVSGQFEISGCRHLSSVGIIQALISLSWPCSGLLIDQSGQRMANHQSSSTRYSIKNLIRKRHEPKFPFLECSIIVAA